ARTIEPVGAGWLCRTWVSPLGASEQVSAFAALESAAKKTRTNNSRRTFLMGSLLVQRNVWLFYSPLPEMSILFFATASRGTEEALADELREIGIPSVEPRRGGVAFG